MASSHKGPTTFTYKAFKTCIVGDSNVGKSSLFDTYMHGYFSTHEPKTTLRSSFKCKTMEIHRGSQARIRINWELWDTAGQERYHNLSRLHYRGSSLIILAFDVTSQKSFRSLVQWLHQVEEMVDSNVHRIVVGCKIDLEAARKVPREAALEWALSHNMPYFECSSKENEGLREIFFDSAEVMIRQHEKVEPTQIVPPNDAPVQSSCVIC